MSVQLPTKDQWTTYNYELGARRCKASRGNKVCFHVEDPVGDEWRPTLVVCRKGRKWETVKLLPEYKVIEYVAKSLDRYGEKKLEKVLSATETGSLYWNMKHHFGSVKTLLGRVDQVHGQSGSDRQGS